MIQFLKEYSVDEIKLLCGGEEPLRAIKFALSILDIICFIIPILLIVLITVSFVKNVIAQSVDDMKKEFLIVLKKIISCVAIFFVPTIVSVVMSVLGNLGIDYAACIDASKEDDLSKYKVDVDIQKNNNNYSFTENGKTKVVDGQKNNDTSSNNNQTKNVSTDHNIFIGDSRTLGMERAVGNNNDYWIAKSGEGYQWFKDTALSKLNTILQENKDTHYNIFINLGVNDIDNADKYKQEFQTLANKLKNHNIIIVSVNPLDETRYKKTYISNDKIEKFNQTISTTSNVTYCDTYNKIKNNFSTDDGLHYTSNTYKKIYQEMKNCL